MEQQLSFYVLKIENGFQRIHNPLIPDSYLRLFLKHLFFKKNRKSSYESEVTVYECEDCTGCSYEEKCTKAKGNKRLHISKSFLEKRQESYENILSETGIKYRINHSIQVEGAFGVLKNDYEFQRFLLREKQGKTGDSFALHGL